MCIHHPSPAIHGRAWALRIAAGCMLTAAFAAGAQQYPARPVRMLTAEAGGGADVVARLVAQGLSQSLGRQFIVENQGAASGMVAAQTVARAAPDGYTLL